MSTKQTTQPYVIVRGSLATFCGFLESRSGREVTLSDARMIGYWEKRHMLSTLAALGPVAGKILLSESVARTEILDATGVLHCSAVAARALRDTPAHEAK